MRNIKFRARDVVTGEVLGQLYMGQCFQWVNYEKQNNIVIEQFTGLKDKNGSEIYEDDRLSIYFISEFSNDCIFVDGEGDRNAEVKVCWDNGGYWLLIEDDSTWYTPQSLDDCASIELIS